MAFAFTLPTTSPVSFAASFASSSAPSLPSATTTRRSMFRDSLKRYKRLSAGEQANAIPSLLTAIDEYLRYLYTVDAYITSQDIVQIAGFETEWRAVLSRRTGPAEAPRIKRPGLDYEVHIATATLGYAHTLRARTLLAAALHSSPVEGSSTGSTGSSSSSSSAESTINQATQHLTTAASVFLYLQHRTAIRAATMPALAQPMPPDVSTAMYTALASLCLASATLLAVLKQDPYPSIVAMQHDKNSREWMYKAPTVPKGVKALLLARLCMHAAELAGKAAADVGAAPGARGEVKAYCDDLARTAKAKACRFLAVDAEAQGKLGEAIGWVVAGKEVLGLVDVEGEEGGSGKGKVGRGLDKLKKAREEKKMEKAPAEGLLAQDAGRMEEALVLSELERKWRKINDSVNFESIKPSSTLLVMLPRGRPIFPGDQAWTPPKLSSAELVQLQSHTPGVDAETDWLRADDSDDDDVAMAAEGSVGGSVPGGFPRSQSTGYY
ncbi:hypothetical protein DRE_04519 [Drechslerella stenobrocha 248]|uniref:pH-response regulator protein palC n=1 Tax=Drechslerella stenobrocha 248 TaxID=1043628 RepID=W7I237_9PEZI|nr:hypothetical protein DRE_04519 [Drechslerella stenobrocha 248]